MLRRAYLLVVAIICATDVVNASTLGRSINNGLELKIMPLGASIVYGTDSTDGNGFRLRLRDLLESGGNKVSYVGKDDFIILQQVPPTDRLHSLGTAFHGNMSNNACEAYPGRTIDEADQHALHSHAYKYLPNVVLVHLGTNDCMREANETAGEAADHFSTLLSTIKEQDADTLVLASTLIRNLVPSVDQCIAAFNDRLPSIVRKARATGQKVALVNMHDAVPRSDINSTDATHPNDAGYAIMARMWYEGLVNASAFISPPNSTGKGAPVTPSAAAELRHTSSVMIGMFVMLVVWVVLA
ncbi:hypothetical protein LTR97_005402 [Elasticomyces elasticus]|uniref:SGNH hydrolase-type esterase domain-containing protein n=1 Tax=Elasticomyces elasticus TaxID=574655 RepID=A0AAN7WAS7_9PEZI|nr:hypothetical protein LTR97_005402 [Elasticomyces elasticus]